MVCEGVWEMMVIWVLVAGYVLGSVPFGYLAGRAKGVDLMKVGSGNIGATNVLRSLGVAWAIPVLVLDAGKGAAATVGGRLLLPELPHWGAVLGAAAALAGHTWSLFLGLRGGKGAATGAGAALVVVPRSMLVALAVFVLLVALTRYVSLGSMAGAAAALVTVLVTPNPLPARLLVVVGAALIIFRHRRNIQRLLAGTEARLGERVRQS